MSAVNANFNLNQINPWFINYNQYIQNKTKNKLHMEAINYACFEMKEKNKKCLSMLHEINSP